MPLGTEVGLGPGGIVLDGDPASSHGKGLLCLWEEAGTPSNTYFLAHVYCGQTVAHLSNC